MEKNKKLKKARGSIPVETVCNDCEISVSAYRKYEAGSRRPRDEVKRKLSEYFNIPIAELFY